MQHFRCASPSAFAHARMIRFRAHARVIGFRSTSHMSIKVVSDSTDEAHVDSEAEAEILRLSVSLPSHDGRLTQASQVFEQVLHQESRSL